MEGISSRVSKEVMECIQDVKGGNMFLVKFQYGQNI